MTDTATVTVIVPGFNVAAWAGQALESLVTQTFPNWTALLIDDASTDSTGAVFAEAAVRDSRFRVLTHPDQRGLGAARNTGLDQVTTRYLAFLDADDVYTPHALTSWLASIEQSGSDFVVGAYRRLRLDAAGSHNLGAVQPWVRAATCPARCGTTLAEHPEASGNIVAWSKLSRTGFWRAARLRFPEGSWYEDQIVAQQMYTAATRFDVISEVVAHWRVRADGTSITQRTNDLTVLRDYLNAIRAGLAVLDRSGHVEAALVRVGLIASLDLPPLIAQAHSHDDDHYRAELGAFARDILARSDASHIPIELTRGITDIARW